MCLVLPEILNESATITHIMKQVEEEARWVCDTIRQESYGLPVKAPDADFINGEGDDKTNGLQVEFHSAV